MNEETQKGSPLEVFGAFLKLGLTSFGGPIAHLGYFRAEFVERRRWLSERNYVDVVALAQFLPGPASSQTGFAIGLMRAGYAGGLAAWLGFTLPSAILLLAFAWGAAVHRRNGLGRRSSARSQARRRRHRRASGAWAWRRTCARTGRERRSRSPPSAFFSRSRDRWGRSAPFFSERLPGLVFCKGGEGLETPLGLPVTQRAGALFLALFFLLLALAFVPVKFGPLQLFEAFYRSGALVFGGGHVVLPLLRDAVVTRGWISDGSFLAGYGAAQAVPGPLFTFAAYLGAASSVPPGGIAGAAIALVAIFLPGVLILMGTLPFWQGLRKLPKMQAAMQGVNAAVVGLLGAALYQPVWTSTVATSADFAVSTAAFVLLVAWKTPPFVVVVLCAMAGLALR